MCFSCEIIQFICSYDMFKYDIWMYVVIIYFEKCCKMDVFGAKLPKVE